MATNKVILNGEVKIDLTKDTVKSEDVAAGKTFHSADGVQRTGSAVDLWKSYLEEHGYDSSDRNFYVPPYTQVRRYYIFDDYMGANIDMGEGATIETGYQVFGSGSNYGSFTFNFARYEDLNSFLYGPDYYVEGDSCDVRAVTVNNEPVTEYPDITYCRGHFRPQNSYISKIELSSSGGYIGDCSFYDDYTGVFDENSVILCYSEYPPTLGSGAFYGFNGRIIVYSGSVEEYKNATNWSNFADQIEGGLENYDN
jgi:hypothetical protein